MLTITLPIVPKHIRLPYLQIMCGSLRTNDLTGFKLFVNFEPPWDYMSSLAFGKMTQIIESLPMEKDIVVNDKRLRLDLNTETVIQRAFDAGSDFNLHIEDDLVFSPDALDLARWYYGQFHTNPPYYCYGLYSSENAIEHPLSIVKLYGFFVGWGWGTFCKGWEEVFLPPFHNKDLARQKFGAVNALGKEIDYSWDMCVNASVQKRELTMLIPRLSRSKHGGMFGEHTNIEVFSREFSSVQPNLVPLKDLGGSYLLEPEKE